MSRTEASVRPRILQLVTHNRPGGVSTLAEMVEAGLRDRGYEIETLALRSAEGWVTAPRDMLHVAAATLFKRPDCIFSYQAAASIYGSFLGWVRGVPLRVTHHTAEPSAVRAHWRLLDTLFGILGVHTHLVANSEATRSAFDTWPKAYRNRFVLIPHGVDPLQDADGLDWREQLAVAQTSLLLVATGRLTDQKNHVVAVDALPLLPDAHLVIAGEGPNRAMLTRRASDLGVADRLHLVGNVDRPDLGRLLAAADIYLFPSVWETFGLAGVEAAMAGLPIVASDLPVLHEVLELEPQETTPPMVRFHAAGSPSDLAAAVRDTASVYPPQERREAFARRHRTQHGRARMLDRYEAFLRAAIPHRFAVQQAPASDARLPRR